MSKRPSFQFYPSDWRNDPALRLCSIAARGLWMEMMCLMHEGQPYGHLTVMGRPITPDSLARLSGEPATSVKRWLKELAENEVFSTTEEGVIFSRRMVRDEEIRGTRAAGGKAGSEHGHKGAAHGIKGGRPKNEKPPSELNGRGVLEPPLKPPPSSSSSSSVNSEDKSSGADAPKLDLEDAKKTESDRQFWDNAKAYLAAAGVSNPGAIIGKWVRDHTKPETANALAQAQLERAVEPVAFIQGYFRRRKAANAGGDLELPIC